MHKREMAHTKAVFKSTMTEAEERYKERIGVIEKEKVHQQKEIESLKFKIKHLQDELKKPKGKGTEKLSTSQCTNVVAQKVTQIVGEYFNFCKYRFSLYFYCILRVLLMQYTCLNGKMEIDLFRAASFTEHFRIFTL